MSGGPGGFHAVGPSGVALRLKVQPRARRTAIEGTVADADGALRLKLAVAAPPEDGRANAAVIETLAEAFGLPKSAFRVTHGASARLKTVAVDGDPAAIVAALSAWSARHTPQA